MLLFDRIPTRYLVLVPALFFAGIGMYDIVSDAVDHKLTMFHICFNLAFCVPLVVRHRLVYLFYGGLASVFAVYIFLALLVFFFQYMHGAHFRYPFDTFVVGPLFTIALLLSGLALIRGGRKQGEKVRAI